MSWKTPAIATAGVVAAVVLAPAEAILSLPIIAIAAVATIGSGAVDILDGVAEVEKNYPQTNPVSDISSAVKTTAVCSVLIVGIVILAKSTK